MCEWHVDSGFLSSELSGEAGLISLRERKVGPSTELGAPAPCREMETGSLKLPLRKTDQLNRSQTGRSL